MILPLYLIEAPVLELPAQRAADELAKAMSERQLADWRSLEVKLQQVDTRRLVGEPIAALATAIARAVTKHAEPVAADKADPSPAPAEPEPAKSDDSDASAKLVEELEAKKAEMA